MIDYAGGDRITYDPASRLRAVSDGNGNPATYNYLANSPLVSQIFFTNSGARRMTTTKQWDNLNRLTQVSSVSSVQSVAAFSYRYNVADQRTAVTNADSSYWAYAYDSLGQVISGKKYWSDNTPVAGQQFEYTFDDIANRQTTGSGGDQSGGSLRTAFYAANSLNQYTSRNFPGYVWMFGTANSSATVSLWGSDGSYAPTVRKGQYFEGELWLNNVGGAFYTTITNLAVLNNGSSPDIVTNIAGNVFVAKTPEPFGYDGHGNLTSDGRWAYTWDASGKSGKRESGKRQAGEEKAEGEKREAGRRRAGKRARFVKPGLLDAWSASRGPGRRRLPDPVRLL